VSTNQDFWPAFRRSRTAMAVFDDDRTYTDVNESACRVLGRSRDEIVGRPVGRFSPAASEREQAAIWQRFDQRGHAFFSWDVLRAEGPPTRMLVGALADVPEPGLHLSLWVADAAPVPRSAGWSLSPREREVTRLLACGLSGADIARELFLSRETVRTHIRNAMEAVGARTRAHLVAIALREDLL